MYLVNKEQRSFALLAQHAGAVEGFAQIRDAGENRRKLFEYEIGFAGEQTRDRGFAGARRSPQNEARNAAAFQHARQCAVGSDDMILANDVGKLSRAQTIGQRARCALLKSGSFEKIGHGTSYRASAGSRQMSDQKTYSAASLRCRKSTSRGISEPLRR